MSSLSISTVTGFLTDLVNEYFIPLLDKSNPNYSFLISKW